MLNITGMNRFYYLRNFHDMRCKYEKGGDDMNSMEKSMLLDELFALCKADKEREAKLLEKLDRMTEQMLALNENSQRLLRQNDELKRMLSDRDALIEKLRKDAKFMYAYEQGGDLNAKQMLEYIGWLYWSGRQLSPVRSDS